jgi:hypothetical protein
VFTKGSGLERYWRGGLAWESRLETWYCNVGIRGGGTWRHYACSEGCVWSLGNVLGHQCRSTRHVHVSHVRNTRTVNHNTAVSSTLFIFCVNRYGLENTITDKSSLAEGVRAHVGARTTAPPQVKHLEGFS